MRKAALKRQKERWKARALRAEQQLKRVYAQNMRLVDQLEDERLQHSFIRGDYEEMARRRSDEAVWSNGGGG